MGDFVDVAVGDRQNRLEVVDVGATDQLFIGGHDTLPLLLADMQVTDEPREDECPHQLADR